METTWKLDILVGIVGWKVIAPSLSVEHRFVGPDVCDTIKENESELEKNKNSFFISNACLNFRAISS